MADVEMLEPTSAVVGSTSTDLSTPLLLSSNSVNDGGNVASSQSNGVATVAMGAPPYFRYRLASRNIPPNALPPRLLEQANISSEGWINFWTWIKPLVLELESIEKFGTSGRLWFCLMWIWIIPSCCFENWTIEDYLPDIPSYYDRKRRNKWLQASLFVPMVIISIAPLKLFNQKRQSKLSGIATFCQDVDAAIMFHANGFSLECELVPSEVHGSRMHLLILPVGKPYTRFEVYNGLHRFWSSYTTSIGSGDVRPDCLDSLPLEDWNGFWSAMRKLYEARRKLHYTWLFGVGCLVGCLVALSLLAVPELFSVICLVGAALLICLSLLDNYHRFHVFLAAKVNLVYNFAIQSAPRGVYIEHRRLYCFHPWWGLYERHYVYMFQTTGDPNQLERADTIVGSMSNVGVRERHGLLSSS